MTELVLSTEPTVPSAEKLDIVTVCYFPELHFLELQARSLARFFEADSIGRIIVIANGPASAMVRSYIETVCRRDYDALWDKVEILDHSDVAPTMPTWGHGWRTQQVLKLCIARLLTARAYLVLDAKNHFIKRVACNTFIAADGRLRTWFQSYRMNAEEHCRASLRYFSVDAERFIDRMPPSITPIPLLTNAVRQLLDHIQDKEKVPFEGFFFAPNDGLTEFLLYYGYLILSEGSCDSVYAEAPPCVSTLFVDKVQEENRFDSMIWKAYQPEYFAFGVHSMAIPQLRKRHAQVISKLWHDCGLLGEEIELPYLSLASPESVNEALRRRGAAGSSNE